jgi:hypothetical protein
MRCAVLASCCLRQYGKEETRFLQETGSLIVV